LADRRRRHVQFGRRSGKTLVTRAGFEGAESVEMDRDLHQDKVFLLMRNILSGLLFSRRTPKLQFIQSTRFSLKGKK
jgi:hypothetical protein